MTLCTGRFFASRSLAATINGLTTAIAFAPVSCKECVSRVADVDKMGRRPNPVIAEFFQRGNKLSDNSNRYDLKSRVPSRVESSRDVSLLGVTSLYPNH